MKALIKLLFTIIACAIVLLVILYLVNMAKEAFFAKSLEQLRRFETYKPYTFNITDLLVNPNDPTAFDDASHINYYENSNDPTFCKDLRNCIEMNIKGNKQCVITYKVKPGVFFNISIVNDSIFNSCPNVTVKEELYSKTERKICTFKSNSINHTNKLREDNVTLIDYQPFIHNCYIPENLGSYNILDDKDTINYLYSGRGNESGYDFINGGTVRIVVTNVSVKNDFDATCSYSLYVCGQSAIADKENDTSVYVFKKIQNLNERELYYNETIVWAGLPEIKRADATLIWFWNNILRPFIKIITIGVVDIGYQNPPPPPPGYNIYGYKPRTYEFNFTGKYKNKESLIDAVDAGMWEWSKTHYYDKKATECFRDAYYSDIANVYFSYSPIDIANISEDSTISFSSNCWNVSFEDSNVWERTKLVFGDNVDVFVNSTSLYHIYNFSSFTIGDKIRMVLGIKKIFITGKPFHYDIGPPLSWILTGFGQPTSWTVSILEVVNKNYKPTKDLSSRVIMVMDPVTICSE